ncbi:MAG: hypothetical protein RSD88_08385 [Anaerovoracaceae bacterium]
MGIDKKKLIAGIAFLVGTVLCITGWIHDGYSSYYLTGSIVFTVVGIGFLKTCKQ